ncbi:MAG: hypothetical protein IJ733_03575 [Lachnospiraceae bacterium]|nr:hypothetical protein [Lachnospiraceae bacterium]
MSGKIRTLLEGKGGNYILPFFWQHGEDEETLRRYMQVIQASNIQEVCVESRPHPDFAGPKWWKDMDDIGGQVYPQGEDDSYDEGAFRRRDGSFYHYMLGKLGSSAAAIEPLKQGNSMCEIFGAYGWKEGVKLEKYLVDHFMVRGINHFVPHAFSPAEFPDPDCPPHFYAQGHNPQYRHFGALMAYTNRVLELLNGGRHIAPVAVLYHGDASWSGHAMTSHEVGRKFADSQLEFDYIPQDVFAEPEMYEMKIERGMLQVNTQAYRMLFVPECDYIRTEFAKLIPVLEDNGIEVIFVNGYPKGIADAQGEDGKKLLAAVKGMASVLPLLELVDRVREAGAFEIRIAPRNDRIRFYHYEETDGSAVFLFVNEGTETYQGEIALEDSRNAYFYDAWKNEVTRAAYDGKQLSVSIEPFKSCILVLDADTQMPDLTESFAEKRKGAERIGFTGGWKRSLSDAVHYPAFGEEKEVSLPDALEKEEPVWSGIARYTNRFTAESGKGYLLEITDAAEGVEVFINGKSLGIQVVPVYEYDLTDVVKAGENEIRIEVATTLEREMSTVPDPMAEMLGGSQKPENASGLNGQVLLYERQK